jgi:hypothetical protein
MIEKCKAEPLIVGKWYTAQRLIFGSIINFPKTWRFTLGEEAIRISIDIGASLETAATKNARYKPQYIADADRDLARLKSMFRVAVECKIISIGAYEDISKYLVEIGKMIGGWYRSVKSTDQGPLL